MEDTDQPPKDSYRALLQLKADGVEISDFELQVWRREEELVRCAFCYPRTFRDCGLLPAHFIAPVHALAWQAIWMLADEYPDADELDPAMLISVMRGLDEQRLAGPRGHNWLMAILSEPAINPVQVLGRHVKDVRAMHRNRRWNRRYAELGQRVKNDPDIAGIQTDYVRAGREIAFAVDGEHFIEDPIDQWEWDARDKDAASLVRIGVDEIDHACGGGHGRGEMLVWGGGTGHGKSYSAAYVLKQQARLQQNALYISCEDPKELMFCRLIGGYAEPTLEPRKIRARTADPEIVETAIRQMRAEFAGRISVIERKKPTISRVCEEIRQYRYSRKIDLVIIDYLQAITADEPMQNKVQEMSHVTSMLKKCFTDCNVAGIVMSQYNRESYKDGTEPGLNSCKYCGDIENEAEVMVLLWRDPEGVLRVKMPKVKWASAQDLSFEVPVDDVSGWHGKWKAVLEKHDNDD